MAEEEVYIYETEMAGRREKKKNMTPHEILVEFAKERFENPHSNWLFDDNSVANIAKSTTQFDKSDFLNLDKS